MQRRPDYPSVTVYPPHAGHQQQGQHPGYQQPPQMQPVPVMPSMSGVARAARLISTLVTQTVSLTVLVGLAQIFAPEPYRPSTLLGQFSGGHEAAELKAKQEATALFQQQMQLIVAEMTRTTAAYESLYQRMNAVTQQAYQMEAMVLQYQEQTVSQGMEMQSTASNLADLACLASPFFQGTDFAALSETCGMGKKIRQGQANELAMTARNHSAIVPRDVFESLPDPAAMRTQENATLQQVWQTISAP